MRNYQSFVAMVIFQFRELYRDRTAFFFNLVLPVVLIGVFGLMYGGNPGAKMAVGLVDQDHGAVARSIGQALAASGTFEVHTGSEDALTDQLTHGKLRAVLLLPEHLSDAVQARQQPGMATVKWDQTSQSSGAALVALESLIGQHNLALSGAKPVLVARPSVVVSTGLTNAFDFLLPGMIIYALISAGFVGIGQLIPMQRQSGVLRHLFSTPLSISIWTGARIVSNVLMALVQMVLVYGTAVVLFHASLPADIPRTLVVLTLCAVANVSMGMAVGCLIKSPDAARPVVMVLYMTMTLLGGVWIPVETAPGVIQSLCRLMPTTYMTHALRLVMMQGRGLQAAAADLGVIIACILVFTSVAVWRMRQIFVAP